MTRSVSLVRRALARAAITGAVLAASLVPAVAQSAKGNPWGEGTMLFGSAGLGRQIGPGPAVGAGLGWEVVPYLTIEGRGVWFGEVDGARGFTALLGGKVPLLPGRTVVPFVSGSVGFNRLTLGQAALTTAPDFYRRRVRPNVTAETFDDFATAVAGGADVFLSTHVALRPEVSLFIVRGPSEVRAVPTVGVTLSYHFENHEITPSRR